MANARVLTGTKKLEALNYYNAALRAVTTPRYTAQVAGCHATCRSMENEIAGHWLMCTIASDRDEVDGILEINIEVSVWVMAAAHAAIQYLNSIQEDVNLDVVQLLM